MLNASRFCSLFFAALNLQPGDALMYKLRADIRGKMGMVKEAIEDYEQAIYLMPQSNKVH